MYLKKTNFFSLSAEIEIDRALNEMELRFMVKEAQLSKYFTLVSSINYEKKKNNGAELER